MRIKSIIAVAMLLCISVSGYAQGKRVEELFNFGWKFHAGDVNGCEQPGYDDSDWESVDLPHDYQIGQPWVAPAADERANTQDEGANRKSRLSSRGFKEMGIGWYRKTFVPEASLRGNRVLLDVEGIMLLGDVYVNGQHVGGTDYGYVGFESDITKQLKWGEENVVAVKADTREPDNSRWYTGGGLFRDIHLVYTDPRMHFSRHPLYVKSDVTSIRGDKGDADVIIQAEATTLLDSRTKELTFGYKICDAGGNVVAEKTVNKRFYARQKTNEYVLDTITLSGVNLWSCENPYMYKVEVLLFDGNGTCMDAVSDEFGVRKIEYSPEYGFHLNGKKVLFKGIANHHTLGALGAACYERAIEKRIKLLKEFGVNHIRTSHNPYSESFLRLCDHNGILVVDELYDKWLDQYVGGRKPWVELWQHDIPEFVKRDRNHPSVVMWSLGNELQTYWDLPYADWGVTPYKMQRELLRRYDKERPVTVAMHPRGRNIDTDSLPAPLALETDIAAYNYRYMYFPGDGRRFPNMIFYQSEANTTMMGPNFFEMDLDKVVGLAYWGLIDYLGESNGWPEKGWAQGVFDISLEPKPSAYYIKSYFNDEPMVHIGVLLNADTFDWNGIKVGVNRMTENWNLGEMSKSDDAPTVTLVTYTNADEVELIQNGRSLGIQKNNRDDAKQRNKITWNNVVWKEGEVEAIARTGGKVVARHKLESSGKAVALELSYDNESWKADGLDLQHVRIHAVDKKGRRVYNCTSELKFSVEGDARIVAVSSGDHSSDEPNVGNERRLFDGSAMVILRSGQKGGDVVLKVESEDLGSASVKFSIQK